MGIVIAFPPRRSSVPKNLADVEAMLEHAKSKRSCEQMFHSLDALVVFSPEIMLSALCEYRSSQSCGIEWGDVFLKTGDTYPFIFTIFTKAFVRRYYLARAEIIHASPQDIILARSTLTPSDVLQAMMKWVNVYHQELKGLPVELESEEVIKGLVCDYGEEVLVPECPELFTR